MNLQNASFIALLALVTLAFFGLLIDFAQPIFWAATLAVLFHPVHGRFLALVGGGRSRAALLTLSLICVTVIIPTWFIGSAVVHEAGTLYSRTTSGEIDPARAIDWLDSTMPTVNKKLAEIGVTPEEIKSRVSSAAIQTSKIAGSLAITAGQNALRFGVMALLMLYVLFFCLRDGDQLVDQLVHALPIGDERERALFAKFAEVTRATIKGTLVIGAVQGGLGGLIFGLLGIEGAIFWGVVMVVMSLVPLVGPGLVWAPAAVILIANGAYIKGAVLVAFGVLAIGMIDNILRPILVGRDTRMPDYLVLLSTLGGLTLFGASGIVIGPVIAALFLTLWMMFAEEHNALVPAEAASPPVTREQAREERGTVDSA